jgi:Haemolysin secretion/activation protein ShlB/FhaC/HecB
MGANFLALLLSTAVLQSPQPDTVPPFSNPAVQHLVERATARRHESDSAVADYQATIRYRLSVAVGHGLWSKVPATAVEEQIARVQWQRPNDLRIDVLGRRFRSRRRDLELSSIWARPWFVPRGVDDSVRIFSNRFPATGALHPLASTGPAWYRYAITGDLTVTPGAGRAPLRLFRVQVTPRRSGPALIVGQMWIDSASAEVVRLAFRYLGTALWVRPEDGRRGADSAKARRANSMVNRIVSVDADLEYGLQEGRYWMPYRQVIAGQVKIPLVSDLVIPFQATTTFEEYTINAGHPIVFELPLLDEMGLSRDSVRKLRRARLDSLRAARRGQLGRMADSLRAWDYAGRWHGGRFELHRPPNAALDRYDRWPDSLSLELDPTESRRIRETQMELATLSEGLPDSVTGRSDHGFAYENLSDALRYDRAQGLSIGLGYRVRMPLIRFASLYGTLRYGLSDDRVTGRLTLVRDGPEGRWTAGGYRDVVGVDPFSPGHTLGNTLDGLFVAHDDADYLLVQGGAVGYQTSLRSGLDLIASLRVERETSVEREAHSAVNDFLGGDGEFPPNPPVSEGTYGGASLRLTKVGTVRWDMAADLLGNGDHTTGRLYGDLRLDAGGAVGGTLRLKAGVATSPTLPQSLFRLGGEATVRGFDYGTRRGQSFWAAQLDVSPLGGRLQPIAFVDAGQTAGPGDLFSSTVLAGAGAGVSLFGGALRFDLSHPLTPNSGGKVRFDIVVGTPR